MGDPDEDAQPRPVSPSTVTDARLTRWMSARIRDSMADVQSPLRTTLPLLHRRLTAGVVAWLLAFAAVGWALTARQATSMDHMLMGLADVGTGVHGAPEALTFLAMWTGMMVAMMFPAVIPMVLAHRMVVQRRGEGSGPTVAFVAGYLLVWMAAGVVPLAAVVAFSHISADAADGRWLATLAGMIIASAGVYQFTPWKALCLRACRSPLGFVVTHDFGAGSPGALRAGLSHGAFCLGCCWALMTVLVVMGLMNLLWMVALALVFLAEKTSRYGGSLTKVMGTVLVVLGLLLVAFPDLLPTVSGADSLSPMDGMHGM
jgi:predicted metal-binding membrane protein